MLTTPVPGFKELNAVLGPPVGRSPGAKAALFKERINFKCPGGVAHDGETE